MDFKMRNGLDSRESVFWDACVGLSLEDSNPQSILKQ